MGEATNPQPTEALVTQGAGSAASIDATMLRVVVAFRLIALVWMAALVGATLADDPGADEAVVVSSLALALIWSGVTVLAALKFHAITGWRWVLVDAVVPLLVAVAPYVADAERAYFGGFPISWLVVAVYSRGLVGGLVGAIFLSASQVIGSAVAPLSGDPFTAGGVIGDIAIFFVPALVLGWAVVTLRRSERLRLAEQQRRLAAEEREQIATHLHDSVLQTLALIQRRGHDTGEVRYLARRQEQELRQWLHQFSSPYDRSFKAAVRALGDEIEDLHRIRVDTVAMGDCELDEAVDDMIDAAREALANAAKHAGVDRVSLTSEVTESRLVITVRDRGVGFHTQDADTDNGLGASIRARMERIGGTVDVHSAMGKGTEITLTLGRVRP